MSRDYLTFDTTPYGESCEQLGPNYDPAKARREAKAFKNQLERMIVQGVKETDPNPDRNVQEALELVDEDERRELLLGYYGLSFRIKSEPHDFGNYLILQLSYDEGQERSAKLAYWYDGNVPEHWDEQATKELSQGGRLDEAIYADKIPHGELEAMVLGDCDCFAADGCQVEPDGTCPHGYKSPLLVLGLI